jgi:NAD(P)H dehydrogenase (quinone)
LTIAITGATGQLGRLVLASLARQSPTADVVALARSLDKTAGLGVPARELDYDWPETLGPALAGVDTLLLVSGPVTGVRVAQHRHVIGAAKRAGVGRVVYTSALHADRSPLDVAPDHRATEADLKASGLPFTILRNGWYTENYTAALAGAVERGAVVGSAGDGRIASATRADLAEAAAAVLAADVAAGSVYELTGDTAWSLPELAAAASTVSGKPVVYKDLPSEQYGQILAGVGLPDYLVELIIDADAQVSQGALATVTGDLAALLGRPTTSLADAVAEALKG